MSSATPQAVYLKDYRPPAFYIDQVDLHVDLDEERTRVVSRLALRRNPEVSPGDGVLRLDGEELELSRIALDDQPLSPDAYQQDETGLSLFGVPDRCVLETEVAIHPARNTALEGLYRSGPMLCTQCEAEGFRKLTFFLDRPDVMARYRVTLVGDRARYPVLLSNGNPVEHRDLPDGRHLAMWEDPFPKPSYLFALVAGDLCWVEDAFVTASGRPVRLRIHVEPQHLDQCDHAMGSLKRAMAWDEARYGREYDLDVYNIVAVNDFNMGAMENKGLNIFNAHYVLARPDTATDRDFQGIEGVIAHEYFHNWTGNRITCRDWFQLSLKEGFTVFRDQCFSADMGSAGVKRITDARALRAHQFAEDAGPMAHPVRPASYIEINNFYTSTVYEKGAEVVRMQALLLGPERFRRGTDLYFARHDGQAVTTDDFLACMAEVSGRDLSQFQRWYDQAGTPELVVEGDYAADTGTYTLRVTQTCPPSPGQPHKAPFHIPLALGLLGPDGRELEPRLEGEVQGIGGTRLLELREPSQVFRFTGLPAAPVPSLLRGFSAPVKLRYAYSDQELMFLLAHDPDDFSRWDAAQRLTERVILGNLGRDGRPLQLPDGLMDAFRAALRDPGADRALLAEVLTLPGEAYLGDQLEVVDVEGIHATRESLKSHLAQALYPDWLAAYRDLQAAEEASLGPMAMARRGLKNLCLSYLAQAGESGLALCWEQFTARTNMTDTLAALALLADSDSPYRELALDQFHQRWCREPLVVNKWLSVQALSKRPDTLEKVRALMGHASFDPRNPNRVRALIGSFCTGNPARFHQRDGAGYRFLVDRVLELDPVNPQIAARLLRGLARWRRHDPARQALMRAQLQRVVETRVSPDVYEIATKSLA